MRSADCTVDCALSGGEQCLTSLICLENLRGGVVVETWNEGDSWYRKWSDGWVEQGGIYSFGATQSGSQVDITITFPVNFLDTTYVTSIIFGSNDTEYNAIYCFGCRHKTTSTISIDGIGLNNGQTVSRLEWTACGYAAD